MKKRPLILDASMDLKEAKMIFRGGGIIAFPTETFYGLCVDPFNEEAIKKLFLLKGRPFESPVSVIVKDKEMLKRVAEEAPFLAEGLMKKFWPGPLTIIFKAKPNIPPLLTADTGKIAARVSSSDVCRRLTKVLDSPITATSANPSGKRPPISPKEVLDYFNGSIDMLIDGGELSGKKGSTIVDATGEQIKVIREGEIPAEEILGS